MATDPETLPIVRRDAFVNLPPMTQAQLVRQKFNKARTPAEYDRASEVWSKLRPKFETIEKKFECDAGGDKDIAIDIVEELGQPVSLVIALSQMVLAFAANEKDEFYKALEEALKEARDYGIDEAKGKAGEVLSERAKKAYPKLREALVKFLKAFSKRSKHHFRKLIDRAAGGLKVRGGGAIVVALKVLATPSKIRADECGDLAAVDKAQTAALMRVFGGKELTTAPQTIAPGAPKPVIRPLR